MARLEGKVAFITGAARGQGRAHAVRMAAEGADIIAVDACAKLPASTAPVATVADLEETAALVRAHQRRIVTVQADTRDEDALAKAVASGVEQLGRLDIAVANAGIGGVFSPAADYDAQAFRAVVDIDLTGVFLTAKVAIPHIRAHRQGGSIVLVSSALGLRATANCIPYIAAKHGIVGLMRSLATELGPDRIRVNSIHPTNVDTPLIHHEEAYRVFRPDLENPGRDDVAAPLQTLHLLPISWIEPDDVSEAVLYLTADSGRYITGTTLTIDAGWTTK